MSSREFGTFGRFGILGAGQMGSGIAQVVACAGIDVVIVDKNDAKTSRALKSVTESLGRLVKKDKMSSADSDAALARIRISTDWADFSDVDIVVEAITENPKIKFEAFARLDARTKPEAILASNTSSISITQLAGHTSRPDRVIGMHFMNPVPMMQLCEIIRGLQTSDDTHRDVCALAVQLGKTAVTAADYPGFVVNRILIPMINEACYVLMEGVGSADDIDTAMKLGCNQPMGPLRLADLIGLDTCLAIMETLHSGLGDPKYRPCPLLRSHVNAGWLGRKSGRGFYSYNT